MAPTREIINMMKEMENNIKTHIQETIEEALKRQEIKFNNKIDEVFSKLKDQEKKIEDVMKSQKFLNDKQLPSAFNNIFQRKTSTVITRSNSQIIPISCKNTVTKQSIRYIGPKIWNELPEKIKLCKSLSTFVKKSKAFFLEQQSNQ